MFIVKLGGSLITYKQDIGNPSYRWNETKLRYRVKEDNIRKAAMAIREHIGSDLIIVHGGGTHGHRTVKRWREGISKGPTGMMAWEVKWRMLDLTKKVIGVLGRYGIPAVEVAPSDIIVMDGSDIHRMDVQPMQRILERGGVPTLRGDLASDIDGSWSVISGDDIIVELCHSMLKKDIEKVVMCMEEEGVYHRFGMDEQRLIGTFKGNTDIGSAGPFSENRDETGGITGKISACRKIAEHGVTSQIIGGDIGVTLRKALSGEQVGTIFPGEEQ
ncbi:MAG: isopentenyl phosphate kinase [Thermoplasmatota archaeon]